METSKHIAAVEREGALLGESAAAAGLTAKVPACPGWQVRDLVRHQAYVHSWAARHVAEKRADLSDGPEEAAILGAGPPDEELLAAYREGVPRLVATLRDADQGVPAAPFMRAPSVAAFWARRQAHETAIHRFDAQSAAKHGPPSPAGQFEPAFAADGIDELITVFAAPGRCEGTGRSLLIHAADTGDSWHFRWAREGRAQVRRYTAAEGAEPVASADCTLSGPASSLYLLLWNRCTADEGGLTVDGDPAILGTWNTTVRVRWE